MGYKIKNGKVERVEKVPVPTESEFNTSKNDTGVSFEEFNERMQYSTEIHYGDFGMRVENCLIEQGRESVKALGVLTPRGRQLLLEQTEADLKQGIAQIDAGKICKEVCDPVMQNLVRWYVLQENALEGIA